MGINPDERGDWFLGDIFLYWRMYQRKQAREWERTRMLAFYFTRCFDSKNSIKTPFQMFKLETDPSEEDWREWEEDRKQEEITEVKRILQAHKDRGRQV